VVMVSSSSGASFFSSSVYSTTITLPSGGIISAAMPIRCITGRCSRVMESIPPGPPRGRSKRARRSPDLRLWRL
jgi:hypothetical protein